MVRSAFLLLACLFSTTLWAAGGALRIWDAEAVSRLASESTELTDSKSGQKFGRVSVEHVRKLLDVKDRISRVAGQPARLLIASGDEPNAFATRQNGAPVIAVNLAMLKLLGNDYDAYAAIMGHEISHLTLNHGVKGQNREALRTVASGLLGMVLGRYGVPMGDTIADLTTTAISRSYSREDESAADKLGFTYLRDAGFDPRGAVRVWEKMAVASKSGGLSFLSTHPAPTDRLDEMRRLAAATPQVLIASNQTADTPTSTRQDSLTQPIEQVAKKQPDSTISNSLTTRGDKVPQPQRLPKKSQALVSAEDAVSQNPEDSTAWYRLGAAHLDEGNLEKAKKSFEEALRLQPKFAEAMYGLGTVYFAQGEMPRVTELYPRLRKADREIAKLYFKAYMLP